MTRTSTADMDRMTIVAPAGGFPAFNIVNAGDATPANKLSVTNSFLAAPLGSTTWTWWQPTAAMADFTRPGNGSGNAFLLDGGGATMTFTPTPSPFTYGLRNTPAQLL